MLEDDDREHIAELYLVDDDIAIIGGELMEGLDKDLDDFFDELMKWKRKRFPLFFLLLFGIMKI